VSAPRPRRPYLRFRLFRFRSPLLAESRLFSLPRRTKMFQFRRCPPRTLCIQVRVTSLDEAGFPHSDSSGSMLACSSPERFAAGRVLLRHVAPRHPPCALICFSRSLYLKGAVAPPRRNLLPICSFQGTTLLNDEHRIMNAESGLPLCVRLRSSAEASVARRPFNLQSSVFSLQPSDQTSVYTIP
jgi:hypothetical protein